ncbi:MAG: DUF2690 domain-containing protein [Pseudonocardiales bacterium]|nr:DUF2690 domain-containing protein [Pseudonocardiales bacterium]
MHTKRWIPGLAATAVLLTGGGTAFADTSTPPTVSTAHATTTAASCNGNNCNGRDPIQAGCSGDAVTQYTLGTSVGTLEHRYSRTCNASWARITNSRAGTWFYVQGCYNSYVQTYNVPPGYNNAYTNMIPGGGPTIRVGDLAGHGPC